jgi:hypothetical protein
MPPGVVERPASASMRHGTPCWIAHCNVATGEVVAPSLGATRTDEDCAAPLAQTLATAPAAPWILLVDQLTSQQSATCVRGVARGCCLEAEWGEKATRGIVKSMQTRAEFLSDGSHRIRLLETPQHTSGRHHIELWCRLLVRRLLKRGHCIAVADLRERLWACINDVNRTRAKPFKWTYTGRPLTA